MTIIYGLREAGSAEVRYIGKSDKPLSERLHKHKLNARRNYPRQISEWINSADQIEIVTIDEVDRASACLAERETVSRFHSDGHRLTNSHLLPRPTTQSAA